MVLSRYLSGLLIGIGMTTTLGCAVPPPDPPDPPLSANQVQQLLKCQHTIKQEGAEFTELKMRKLEKCADNVLELQLKLENQLITQAEFDAALVKVRKECVEGFEQITKTSTKLVDGIIAACGPIETVLLGEDDPLLFQGLADIVGPGAFTSVEELAGFICAIKEVTVDFSVSIQVPRLHHLLTILGPEFVQDTGDVEFLPVIPLDERCLLFVS